MLALLFFVPFLVKLSNTFDCSSRTKRPLLVEQLRTTKGVVILSWLSTLGLGELNAKLRCGGLSQVVS